LLVIGTLTLGFAAPAPGQSLDLNLAGVFESQGRHAEARDIYARLLRTQPYDAQVYRRYVAVETRLERFNELVTFTDSLLKRLPGQSDLLMGKAQGLIGSGKKAEGIAVLDGLMRQEPERAREIGVIYEVMGLNPEAMRTYLEYRRRKNNPNIFAPNLLWLYERANDFPAATREAVLLLNVDPGLAREYEGKLVLYVQKAGAGPIVAELRRVQDSALRNDLLVKVYLAAGQTAEAMSLIDEMRSRAKTLEYARYCEQAGWLEPALRLYANERADGLRLTADGEGRVPYDQARILRKLGRVQEAAAMLETSSDPNAIFELAELQRIELHSLALAAENYRKTMKALPAKEQAYSGLAACLIRQGKLAEAEQVLRAMPKKNDQALLDLARIAFYEEDFDSCKSHVRQLIRLNPQGPLVNDGLELELLIARAGSGLATYAQARREFEQGKYESAIAVSQGIIRADSAWADQAYLLLADCYRARKEPNQALAALDELESNLPASSFRAKARYTKAMVAREDLKDETRYRKTMESVYRDFPDSPYAFLARNRLLPSSKPKE
jgi:hypothetical protein